MKIRDTVVQIALPECEEMLHWINEVVPFEEPGLYKYRGHADVAWPLQTSLERFRSGLRVRLPEALLSKTVIDAFKGSSELFFDWTPEDDVEWQSQIQHYGGPTSLLDFTDSFWVALYFAVWPHIQSGLKSDYCVIGIRRSCLPPGLFFHYPKRSNARLLAQQGLFLSKKDPERSVEEMLRQNGIDCEAAKVVSDLEDARRLLLPAPERGELPRIAAIRFVFPAASNRMVLRLLYQMNITGSSLFPDYEGAMQNLRNETHIMKHILQARVGADTPAPVSEPCVGRKAGDFYDT